MAQFKNSTSVEALGGTVAQVRKTPRVLGRGIIFSAALAFSACAVSGETASSDTADQSAALAVDASSSPEAQASIPRISFAEFQAPTQVSQPTIDLVYGAALRLEVEGSVCSGAVINGYLVTAGHCTPSDTGIVARRWLDDSNSTADTVSSWTTVPTNESDLMFAKLNHTQELPSLFFPFFANDDPLPGSRMITATLPGDEKFPILGSLTYVGDSPAVAEGPEEYRHGRKWVFAVGPDNSEASLDRICSPGASGSAVVDDFGHVGVIVSYAAKKHMEPELWDSYLGSYQEKTGSILDGVVAFCIATPVSRDTFNTYVGSL